MPDDKATEKKVEASPEKETSKPAAEKKAKKTSDKSAEPVKKKRGRKRIVPEGRAYIQASFNNTIVTLTDSEGNVLSWSSAGANGFKGPKKATPYAAQVAAEKAVDLSKAYGLERVHVVIKGAGNGREQAIRGLHTGGLQIESISDVTAVPHNGCRSKKTRRT